MSTDKETAVSSVKLTATLFGPDIDFDAVTRRIGTDPTKKWALGDEYTSSVGKVIVRDSGLWQFTATYSDDRFQAAMDKFLTHLNLPKQAHWVDLGVDFARLGALVSIQSEHDCSAFCEILLRHDQVRTLAETGMEVMIDVSADREETAHDP